MRKSLIVVVLMSFAILSAPAAHAQLVDHWKTHEECLVATSSPFYYPSIRKEQKLGDNEVIRGIPTSGCIDLDLPDRMSGRGWVKIEIGRPFVYDRTGQMLRLAACNNKWHAFVPFPLPEKIIGLPCDPDKNPKCRGPIGLPCDPDKNPKCRGPKGDDAVLVSNPPIRFGLTVSGMIGVFDSVPVGTTVENITGQKTCASGRTFDLGLAFGGPGRSFGRIVFAGKTIDEGSTTQYRACPNCEVRTVAGKNVMSWGLNLEGVFRIKLSDRLLFQPMVTVHAGVGHLTGNATQSVGPIGGTPTSVQEVGARELFNSDWLFNGGVGIGVMGDLGQHFTWTATIAGIEWPGIYYGKLGLTYWP